MRTRLVERAREGDDVAFSELVDLDGDLCYGIAYRILRDVERAQDAVHAERNERAFGDKCGGLPDDWEATTVDGADGRRVLLDCGGGPGSVSEVVFTHGGRGWVISGDTAFVDELILTFRLPG